MGRIVLVLVVVAPAVGPGLDVLPDAVLLAVEDLLAGEGEVLEVEAGGVDVAHALLAEAHADLEHAVLVGGEEGLEVEALPDPAVLPVLLPAEVDRLSPDHLADAAHLVGGGEVVDLEELEHVVAVDADGLHDDGGDVHRLQGEGDALARGQDGALGEESHGGLFPGEVDLGGDGLGQRGAARGAEFRVDADRGHGGPGGSVELHRAAVHVPAELVHAVDADHAEEVLPAVEGLAEAEHDASSRARALHAARRHELEGALGGKAEALRTGTGAAHRGSLPREAQAAIALPALDALDLEGVDPAGVMAPGDVAAAGRSRRLEEFLHGGRHGVVGEGDGAPDEEASVGRGGHRFDGKLDPLVDRAEFEGEVILGGMGGFTRNGAHEARVETDLVDGARLEPVVGHEGDRALVFPAGAAAQGRREAEGIDREGLAGGPRARQQDNPHLARGRDEAGGVGLDAARVGSAGRAEGLRAAAQGQGYRDCKGAAKEGAQRSGDAESASFHGGCPPGITC